MVSTATAWEIAIKQALGRLKFPVDQFEDMMRELGFDMLSIHPAHAIAAGGLPTLHGDPFDRMLIAQARVEGLTLVSDDAAIARYDVPLLRAAAS